MYRGRVSHIMARKKMGMAKLQPAVKTLTFSYLVPGQSEGTPGTSTNFIDLSQCASIVNRRFYRQGINWAVSGIKVLSQPSLTSGTLNGSVTISKLPETWVMSNSWEKGFRAWQKMNNNALEESQSVKPKFLDFKIYADEDHHSAGFTSNLLPIGDQGSLFVDGEWSPSKYVYGTAGSGVATQEVIAVGPNFPGAGNSGLDAVSLIEGYAASRALPQTRDPNTPDDSADITGVEPANWLAALFNEGIAQDEEVVTDMITENYQAPYPFEDDGVHNDTMYPNGANQGIGLQIHDLEYVTGTTIGGTSMIKGGMFPCGLIKIFDVNRNEVDRLVTLTVDLVPGNHRGYLCEPMTEM